jgi:VanZ family protein
MARSRRARAWVFLFCWIALTTFFLTFPFKRGPQVLERGYDKVIHTSLFTVMGISAQAAAPWISLLVTGPVAVGLELLQKRLPAREFSTVDMLANITGIFLGLFAYELSTRLTK